MAVSVLRTYRSAPLPAGALRFFRSALSSGSLWLSELLQPFGDLLIAHAILTALDNQSSLKFASAFGKKDILLLFHILPLELPVGIEPTTCRLQDGGSTN